ncbi:DsrE family protein [Alkalimonas collagenimarina]|uniref:DsrE family protein n=1 Tax=Alkalimonas collagenimarina TaxID=400390 RepID=A0ABT9H1N1_9GAMM|nr:DsrE family protein [Alkalimonas collagenimarina]MDP4537193.1 DsrE family protein [Alkalimonas collagenimarina]
MTTSILVWLDSSPFNRPQAREALDYALAMAAVEHQVQLLLTGPAVLLLLPHKDIASRLQLKDMSKAIGLFELYDIAAPIVTEPDLALYQLTADALAYDVRVLSTGQLHSQLPHYQHIVRFS